MPQQVVDRRGAAREAVGEDGVNGEAGNGVVDEARRPADPQDVAYGRHRGHADELNRVEGGALDLTAQTGHLVGEDRAGR